MCRHHRNQALAGDIDSRSCKVRFIINVGDSIDKATVNPIRTEYADDLARPAYSSAHAPGSSGLRKKRSAIPSPVGTRMSLPVVLQPENIRAAHGCD